MDEQNNIDAVLAFRQCWAIISCLLISKIEKIFIQYSEWDFIEQRFSLFYSFEFNYHWFCGWHSFTNNKKIIYKILKKYCLKGTQLLLGFNKWMLLHTFDL